MTEGYPDYARLSLAGGFQLYAATGSIPEDTILFQGYVGSWPYINVFSALATTANPVNIVLIWYSDITFTTSTGFRYAPRNNFALAAVQYANLSPWLQVYYLNQAGTAESWEYLSIYGCTGPATPNQLLSADAPLYSSVASIGANSNVTYQVDHVSPGDASLTVATKLATWAINVWYLSAATYSFVVLTVINSDMAAGGGSFDVPALDTSHQVTVYNETAAAGFIYWSWTLKR